MREREGRWNGKRVRNSRRKEIDRSASERDRENVRHNATERDRQIKSGISRKTCMWPWANKRMTDARGDHAL